MWLICGLWVGIGNAVFFRVRMRKAISDGKITREEANQFARGTIFWILGPCLFLWIVQRFVANAWTFDFMSWDPPAKEIAIVMVVIVWTISVLWIWAFGGAKKLARIYDAANYQTFIWKHPVAFKVVVLLMVAGGVFAMLTHERIFPPELISNK